MFGGDIKFDRYLKMLRSNVPEAAVRQKMFADGFNNNEIISFFSKLNDSELKPASKETSFQSNTTGSYSDESPGGGNTPLENNNIIVSDDRFASFVKMLKLNLPDEAIKLKMQMVGFSSNEINAMFEAEGRGKQIVKEPPSSNNSSMKSSSAKNTAPNNGVMNAKHVTSTSTEKTPAAQSQNVKPVGTAGNSDDDRKLDKYRLMVSMHFKESSIRKEMQKAGYSRADCDKFFKDVASNNKNHKANNLNKDTSAVRPKSSSEEETQRRGSSAWGVIKGLFTGRNSSSGDSSPGSADKASRPGSTLFKKMKPYEEIDKEWTAILDTYTNTYYYWNKKSGTTSWEHPHQPRSTPGSGANSRSISMRIPRVSGSGNNSPMTIPGTPVNPLEDRTKPRPVSSALSRDGPVKPITSTGNNRETPLNKDDYSLPAPNSTSTKSNSSLNKLNQSADEAPVHFALDEEWISILDDNVNKYYYWNIKTGVTTWKNPLPPKSSGAGTLGQPGRSKSPAPRATPSPTTLPPPPQVELDSNIVSTSTSEIKSNIPPLRNNPPPKFSPQSSPQVSARDEPSTVLSVPAGGSGKSRPPNEEYKEIPSPTKTVVSKPDPPSAPPPPVAPRPPPPAPPTTSPAPRPPPPPPTPPPSVTPPLAAPRPPPPPITRVPPPLPSPVVPSSDGGGDKYSKYTMMRKLNLPEGAIRQKMMAEGVLSQADMDAFFV